MQRASIAAGHSELAAWFGCVLVIAVGTLARPYVGLRHDGVIYLGQALLHSDPQVFAHDLFFQYGSQDEFSIASRLLAWIYQRADLARAQIVLVLLTQSATLAIVWMLLRSAGVAALQRWLAMVAICSMSHVYGGHGLFAFSERFVTARMLGEPLALAGLYWLWSGRSTAGLAVLAGACLVHPLVALPVVVAGWLLLLQRNRRWAWLLLTLPLAGMLALGGVKPFPLLLQTYDASWWKAMSVTNLGVFPSGWPLVDWLSLLLDSVVLWVAGRIVSPALAPLLRATVAATVLLMGVTLVGADLAHNVLITQLQLWRIHWLVHLLSLALLPALLLAVWRKGGAEGPLAALAIGSAAVAVNGRFELAWALVAWAAAASWLAASHAVVSAALRRTAFACTLVVLVAVSALVAWDTIVLLDTSGFDLTDAGTLTLLVSTMPSVVLPLAYGALVAQRSGHTGAIGAGALVAVAALYGVVHWDRRPPWTRLVETGIAHERAFQQIIPPDAQVYWSDETAALWGLVRRPSYLSGYQGTGLLFNRQTALEHDRRHRILEPFGMQREMCGMLGALGVGKDSTTACWPTPEAVARVCRAAGGPDFVILDHALPSGHVAERTFAGDAGFSRTVHLHDCKRIG